MQVDKRSSVIFMWGRGQEGQLGLGSLEDSPYPCAVPSLKSRHIMQVGVLFNLSDPIAITFLLLPELASSRPHHTSTALSSSCSIALLRWRLVLESWYQKTAIKPVSLAANLRPVGLEATSRMIRNDQKLAWPSWQPAPMPGWQMRKQSSYWQHSPL